MRIFKTITFASTLILAFTFNNSNAQEGEALFTKNCASCHALGSRLVGPDLIGVTDKRDRDWLVKFIKSSTALIKSGDAEAIAVFEEYNKIAMTDFPSLSDADIESILQYIESKSPAAGSETASSQDEEEVEAVPVVYTDVDIHEGMLLFTGQERFTNGGPSCISCHNVNNDELPHGGLLAKDLTNVYSRMGDAGLGGILGSPPFPSMAASYGNDKALTEAEIVQLKAFFQNSDEVSESQGRKDGYEAFIYGGVSGIVILLLLFAIVYRDRINAPVKNEIFKRQIKST